MTGHHTASVATSAALAEALTRAGRLVSNRTGIVSDVVLMETTAEEPPIYWAQSRPAALEPLAGRPALNDGNGTSVDRGRAVMKAVGEAVERYCSAFYDEGSFVFGAYGDLPGRATPPEHFALFSDAQYGTNAFPFAPFTRDTPVAWTPGRSLLAECLTWAPATFVYIPYDRPPGEPLLLDLISTGLACGPTLARATLKGLAEAVERDAYSIVWQNRLPRPHLDLQSVDDPLAQALLHALRRVAARIDAVLLTLDLPVTVVLVLMTRTEGPPWTVVASGADVSPRHALVLALEEACLAWIGMNRSIAAAADFEPAADYGNLTTLMRHGLAHALDPRLRAAVDFLKTPTERVRIDALPDPTTGDAATDLRHLLDAMRPHVSDVVAVDVTTPDVDAAGFKVVRVIIPELQRMDMDHRYPHRGGRRLFDVPVKLGLAAAPLHESGLNPLPHPFP